MVCGSAAIRLGALLAGVHCVHCQRAQLGEDLPWWMALWAVYGTLAVLGFFAGLMSVVAADDRRYAAAALVLSAVWIVMHVFLPT